MSEQQLVDLDSIVGGLGKDRDFAVSLLRYWRAYGRLSDKQWYWVDVLWRRHCQDMKPVPMPHRKSKKRKGKRRSGRRRKSGGDNGKLVKAQIGPATQGWFYNDHPEYLDGEYLPPWDDRLDNLTELILAETPSDSVD